MHQRLCPSAKKLYGHQASDNAGDSDVTAEPTKNKIVPAHLAASRLRGDRRDQNGSVMELSIMYVALLLIIN